MDLRFTQFEILTGSGAFLLCLVFVCIAFETSSIEAELVQKARIAVEGEELYWVSAAPQGQHIVVSGAAPDFDARRRAVESVAAVPGVTHVENAIAVIGEAGTCQQEFDQLLAEDSIGFKTGKAELSETSFPLLRMLATIARGCGAGIEIAGHTDSVGNREVNLRLSQRRADEVRRHLVSSGVAPHQISAVGYGETQPIADNEHPDGRSENRRIEFRVIGAPA